MGEPGEEEVLKQRETEGCVDKKAQEVGKCGVRDAIGGPGAMVVHFWYTSSGSC